MIDSEWLEDYSERENDEYRRLEEELQSGKDFSQTNYPNRDHFSKVGNTSILAYGNIWPHIPLYDTTFVTIHPGKQEDLIKLFGWGSDKDIEHLIDLSKMGKVQFILYTDPTAYANLDYLEPILRELKPPTLWLPSLKNFFDYSKKEKSLDDFYEVAKNQFLPSLREKFGYEQASNIYTIYSTRFAILQHSGYDEITDTILKIMEKQPSIARDYLDLYGLMIADTFISPLNFVYDSAFSYKSEEIINYANNIKNAGLDIKDPSSEKIHFHEIGNLIMKKLSLLPEGFHAAISLMDKYEQHDVHDLMSDLQKGIKEKKKDMLSTTSQELSVVFDDIWKDAKKISKIEKGIEYGFMLTLGTIGTVATFPVGGVGGLLAGLGYKVLEDKIPNFTASKITRKLSKDFLVGINDFQKKYPIPE